MNRQALVAGMNLLDGISAGELCYLVCALIAALAVGVGLLGAIARAETRARAGEAERVAALRRRLADPSSRSRRTLEQRSA